MIMALLAVAAMVLVDQAVKYWAVTALAPVGSIPLIPDILQLTYVENRGAAFGILENHIWLFVLLVPVVVGAIAYALKKNLVQNAWGRVSLLVICAGAIGNGIDRVTHRYVVDMIEVLFVRYPVFNIADIYVVVGVVLFAVYYLFQHKDNVKTEDK
ncbi:MAG TPA: signal peptidase II [Clostridiales bacterium]|nr:signal peptidase II [Clostridiales bacterium]